MHNILIVFLLFIISANVSSKCKKPLIIAILANPEPINSNDATISRVNYDLIQWLDQSLIQTLIIHPWFTSTQIDDILFIVDGVLFPSGQRNLVQDGQYEKLAAHILNRIKEFKSKNITIPLFGLEQGFNLLNLLLTKSDKILKKLFFKNNLSSLEINPVFKNKLFSSISNKDIKEFKSEKLLPIYINMGVTLDDFSDSDVDSFFKITSLDIDSNGVTYVKSVEAIDYDIYAVHFSPEKICYSNTFVNNVNAIKINQCISNFIYQELKKYQTIHVQSSMNSYDCFDSIIQSPIFKDDYYFYEFLKNPSGNKFILDFN